MLLVIMIYFLTALYLSKRMARRNPLPMEIEEEFDYQEEEEPIPNYATKLVFTIGFECA